MKIMNKSDQLIIKTIMVVITGATVAGLSLGHTITSMEMNTVDHVDNVGRYDGGSDYAAYCIRCHGSDGRGQTAKGRQTRAGDLTQSRVGDAKAIRMVTNGSGEMPSFRKTLDAARIRDVVAYARSFRQ
jgi:mono/diheme cytochrome c family protein